MSPRRALAFAVLRALALFLAQTIPILALAFWLGPKVTPDAGSAWLAGAYAVGGIWWALWRRIAARTMPAH